MTSSEKDIANSLYHSAVVGALMIGYAQVGKKIFNSTTPKLALNAYDVGMVAADLTLAMITKEMLVKKGVIPPNITT